MYKKNSNDNTNQKNYKSQITRKQLNVSQQYISKNKEYQLQNQRNKQNTSGKFGKIIFKTKNPKPYLASQAKRRAVIKRRLKALKFKFRHRHIERKRYIPGKPIFSWLLFYYKIVTRLDRSDKYYIRYQKAKIFWNVIKKIRRKNFFLLKKQIKIQKTHRKLQLRHTKNLRKKNSLSKLTRLSPFLLKNQQNFKRFILKSRRHRSERKFFRRPSKWFFIRTIRPQSFKLYYLLNNNKLFKNFFKNQVSKFWAPKHNSLIFRLFIKNKRSTYKVKVLSSNPATTTPIRLARIAKRFFKAYSKTVRFYTRKRRKYLFYKKLRKRYRPIIKKQTQILTLNYKELANTPFSFIKPPAIVDYRYRRFFTNSKWSQPHGFVKKQWRPIGDYYLEEYYKKITKPTKINFKLKTRTYLRLKVSLFNKSKKFPGTRLKSLYTNVYQLKNNLLFYFWKVLAFDFIFFNKKFAQQKRQHNILRKLFRAAWLTKSIYSSDVKDNQLQQNIRLLNFFIATSQPLNYKKVRKVSGYLKRGLWLYNYRAFGRTLVVSLLNKKKRPIRRFYEKRAGRDWFLKIARKKFCNKRKFWYRKTILLNDDQSDDNTLNYRYNRIHWRRVHYKTKQTRLIQTPQIFRRKIKKLIVFKNDTLIHVQRAIYNTQRVFRIFYRYILKVFYRFTVTAFRRSRKIRNRGNWKNVYYDRNNNSVLSSKYLGVSNKPNLVFFKKHNFTKPGFTLINKDNNNSKFLPINLKNKLTRVWFKKQINPVTFYIHRNLNTFFKLKGVHYFNYNKQKCLKPHRGLRRFLVRWVVSNRFFFDTRILKRLKYILSSKLTKKILKKEINSATGQSTKIKSASTPFKKIYYHSNPTRFKIFFSSTDRYKNQYANLSLKKFKKLQLRETAWRRWLPKSYRKPPQFIFSKKFYRRVFKHHWKWYDNRYISRETAQLKTKWSKKKFYFLVRKLVPASGWYRWKLSFIAPRLSHLFGFRRAIFSTSPWLEILAFTNKLYLLRTHFDYYRAKSLSLTKKYKQYRATEIMFNTRPHKIRYEITSSIILKRLNFFYFSRRHKYFFKKIKSHKIRNKYMFLERQSFSYYYFISSVPSMTYQLSFAPTISWSINYVLAGFVFHKHTSFDFKKYFR